MRRLLLAVACLALSACQREPQPAADAAPPASTAPAATVAPSKNALPTEPHTYSAAITAEDLKRHIRVLSSDEFAGRAPGGPGDAKTIAYLSEQFARAGAKPGNGTTFTQAVPMVETTVTEATLRFDIGKEDQKLALGDDMVLGTRSGNTDISVDKSELVFVGYGVNAPEYDWNDYAGLDVKGKTVVVLVNDPGFIRRDPELFRGKAMTYYGRWTYKFEEAARQGAAGALIVHDTDAAAYGWDVVKNSWTGPQHDLPPTEDSDPRLTFEGWIHADRARALFASSGLDLEALRLAADQRGFKPVPLSATASVTLKSSIRSGNSHNIVAVLPGTEHADEYIVYMGHWDHLGNSGTSPDGDNIFNGAVDNATGVAAALEIAEAFATAAVKPARSIVFMIPTMEESGLLGSRYYVNHPVFPLEKTVGVINMDALPMRGRSKDIAVVGHGQSTMEDLLVEAAKAYDRVVVAEPTPEKGFYYRSDQFNFAKKGVPALYARAGFDLREGGVTAGMAEADDYTANRYHSVHDEFDVSWDYSGVLEDIGSLYSVGTMLAASRDWPQWREGSEFRAAREASLKAAQSAAQ